MRDTAITLRRLVFSSAEGRLVRREFPNSIQKMVDANGLAKGIRNVLSERDEWREGMNLICNACTEKKQKNNALKWKKLDALEIVQENIVVLDML